MKTQFNILSPDGITISPTSFPTPYDAWQGFNKWKKRFEKQGYYSSNNGPIEMAKLKRYCKLIEE